MKAMGTIKKAMTILATTASVIAYPMVVNAFTPVDSGHGTFSNVEIAGTGSTVFMYHHNGTYKSCYVNIFEWKTFQTGKVLFDLHCSNGNYHWYHTFEGCEEVYIMDRGSSTSGTWTLDAKCTSKGAHRTISGEWKMS